MKIGIIKMNDPISDALYQPIRDKLGPLSPYVLIAFIVFLVIAGMVYWFYIRKKKRFKSHKTSY